MLIIKRQMDAGYKGDAIVSLDDLLGTVGRQLPVSNQAAQSAIGKVFSGIVGNSADHPSQSEHIVFPTPTIALDLCPHGQGLVDVGEIVFAIGSVIHAGFGEHADAGGDLLLDIDAPAGTHMPA